jgi:putative ABC transport system ATP-binding protein
MLFQLEGIEKEFQVEQVTVKALRGIDLVIREGEMVSLMGPSGSGKSTLLNILGLIEVPTRGNITFLSKSLTNRNENSLTKIRRDALGFIFQNFNLVPVLTAQENVEVPLYLYGKFSPKEIRDRAREALNAVGLSDLAKHRPSQLSGGQRQRVAIARALVKRPRVILADEPTANLDSVNAEQILSLMQDLKQKTGTAIIVATHDLQVSEAADRTIHLKDGKILTEEKKTLELAA